jgi:hypothetical protein
MKFQFPYFLFALASIAIPIIIHLFNFRRFKTVYFSNIEFLKNIKKESQRKSKLKQILILIARILVVTCLVLAFAQPYIAAEHQQKSGSSEIVGIYIDNSFSMNSLGEQGQLLETARNKAIEITRVYKPGTKFMLATNDQLAKHRNLMNSEQLIQQVTEIGPSPNVVPMSRIYNRMRGQVAPRERFDDKVFYFLSDFQRGVSDFENMEADSSAITYLYPLTAQASNNLYIDSCWFETPSRKLGGEEELFIRIKNQSEQEYSDLPLKFYLNDSLKSLTNFNIEQQGQMVASLKFTNINSGFQSGKVELTDYPVTHDNTWFLGYKVEPEVRVLVIYNESGPDDGSEYFRALFNDDEYVKADFMGIKSVQVSRLGEYNTIVLANPSELSSGLASELAQAVSNGASLVFFPKLKGDQQSYNAFLEKIGANSISGIDTVRRQLSGIDLKNPVYAGIFKDMEENTKFPEIGGHLRFTSATRISEPSLLWFPNGDKALSYVSFGNGKVYVFSFPVDKQNKAFANDILFVPTVYSLVLNSIAGQAINYTIGRDNYIFERQNLFEGQNPRITIRNLKTGDEFIPEIGLSGNQNMRIDFSGRITEAGYYSLESEGKRVALLAFNYSRTESDLRCFNQDELKEKITGSSAKLQVIENTKQEFSEIFDEIQNGKQLWKWFVVFALIFILAEATIIRLWR